MIDTRLSADEQRRVRMTVSCRDTDVLPKVHGAGEVFSRGGQRLQRMHNGLVIEEGCYYGPWMTEIIRELGGHHEPQEEVVFASLLDRLAENPTPGRSPAMVEFGSFWAYYSMWFLTRFPSGRAVCMEPDSTYLEVGRRNFALNGLTGTFLRGMVGSSPGSDGRFREESTGAVVTVEQWDLASVLAAQDLPGVDLLMVDIQGAETALVDLSRSLLESRAVRYAVISTHHHSISGDPLTHQNLLDRLRELGAIILAEHTVGESYSGDGLVAVSFDERDRGWEIPVSRARYRESLFGELEYDLARVTEGNAAMSAQVQLLASEVDAERAGRQSAEAELQSVLASRSWRVARQLQRARTSVRRRRR